MEKHGAENPENCVGVVESGTPGSLFFHVEISVVKNDFAFSTADVS